MYCRPVSRTEVLWGLLAVIFTPVYITFPHDYLHTTFWKGAADPARATKLTRLQRGAHDAMAFKGRCSVVQRSMLQITLQVLSTNPDQTIPSLASASKPE